MANEILEEHIQNEYKWGFTTNIDTDEAPKGLNEDIIRFISAKKNEPEWMLEFRLKAFRNHIKSLIFKISFITLLQNLKKS